MNLPLFDQDFESIRKKAYAIRHNYFDDMDKLLLSLENALMKNGMNVLWAKDRNSLFDNVNSLIDNHSMRRICFDSQLPFENAFHHKVDVIPVEKLEESSDDVDMLVVEAVGNLPVVAKVFSTSARLPTVMVPFISGI